MTRKKCFKFGHEQVNILDCGPNALIQSCAKSALSSPVTALVCMQHNSKIVNEV